MTIAAFLAATDASAVPWPAEVSGPIVVILGDAERRTATGYRVLAAMALATPARPLTPLASAADCPFDQALGLPTPLPANTVVWAPDLHEAFVNTQTNATRLVTTQPLFVLEAWRARLEAAPASTVIATADRAALETHAPEALAGRGPWRDVVWIDAGDGDGPAAPAPAGHELADGFRASEPAARLTAAGRALDRERSAAHLLAMASVCMEVNDLDNAGALLAEADGIAPGWAAVPYERGKYWLRRDDMASAAAAFRRAADALPGFASSWANLGATLGELDRPDDALAAFRQALDADPDNPQVHNNLGVVLRELGRLGESEAAFRRVVALTPELAFGHYNLGHTLFLQGRYQAALGAYQSGQRLDAARSPVQASRLAMARLATGDAAGALGDLQGCLANLPRDYRRQVLVDTQSIAWALLAAMPDLRDWRIVGDWLAAELSKG